MNLTFDFLSPPPLPNPLPPHPPVPSPSLTCNFTVLGFWGETRRDLTPGGLDASPRGVDASIDRLIDYRDPLSNRSKPGRKVVKAEFMSWAKTSETTLIVSGSIGVVWVGGVGVGGGGGGGGGLLFCCCCCCCCCCRCRC